MNKLKLIFLLMSIMFFGYITISSNISSKNDDNIYKFEDEEYIDDIPFNTKEIFDSLQK